MEKVVSIEFLGNNPGVDRDVNEQSYHPTWLKLLLQTILFAALTTHYRLAWSKNLHHIWLGKKMIEQIFSGWVKLYSDNTKV